MATEKVPRKKAQSAKQDSKTSQLIERRHKVLELRRQGSTYQEIAEQLREEHAEKNELGVTAKYDESLAFKDFQFSIKALNKRNDDEVQEQRALDLHRLDGMLATFYDKATQGDVFAFDKVAKVLEMRAAWFGYNAPVKHDLTSSDGSMTPPKSVQFIPYEPDTDNP